MDLESYPYEIPPTVSCCQLAQRGGGTAVDCCWARDGFAAHCDLEPGIYIVTIQSKLTLKYGRSILLNKLQARSRKRAVGVPRYSSKICFFDICLGLGTFARLYTLGCPGLNAPRTSLLMG
jgi:hypothetical protein